MAFISSIKRGDIPNEVSVVARDEGVPVEELAQRVLEGTVVIPSNPRHPGLRPIGIGFGLRTKVNANLGASSAVKDIQVELRKLEAAIRAGADTVMDLSTGDSAFITELRLEVLKRSSVPVGTVPIYQAAIESCERHGAVVKMTEEDMFEAVLAQAREGVDFMTVHCGVTLNSLARMRAQGRLADIVSRGGAFMVGWMLHNEKENPFYERFDDLLDIAREYEITLSLGDGFRPGSVVDATDRAQIQELIVLGELVKRAREAEVQVMVEGPGHVPLDQIAANVRIEKRLCEGAPFYVLGPIVTDVAPGHDHITSAIGGALAAMEGADFLCYVTPAEHLGLPDEEDVYQGVIATRIAAHAADIAKGLKGALDWDKAMSRARKSLNWDEQLALSIDREKAAEYRSGRNPSEIKECTMCGKYCAMRLVGEFLACRD